MVVKIIKDGQEIDIKDLDKDFVTAILKNNKYGILLQNTLQLAAWALELSQLDLNEEEKSKLMEIEKELIFDGKKLGTIAVEIGKKLLEAREVFIKSHSESFIEWYEQLGFNKDQVSIFTKRYQMSIEFPGQKERIINFSDRMIIQLNKKKF